MNIAHKRPIIAFKISENDLWYFFLTVTSFIYVHWLKSYKGSKWAILKILCIIYESFSEILNDIALLGAKFVYSFPWELSFV